VFGNEAKVRKEGPDLWSDVAGIRSGPPSVQLIREVYLQYKERLMSQIRGGFYFR